MARVSKIEKWDYRISWAVMFSFIANATNYVIKSVLPISQGLWGIISLVIGVSIVLVWLSCLREVYKRSSKLLVYSVAFFLFLFFFSCLSCVTRGEPTDIVVETFIQILLFYLPSGIYVVSVFDKQILYKTMLKYSYIMFALMAFRMMSNYNVITSRVEQVQYSMSFGYLILIPTILHLYEYSRRKKIIFLVLSVIEIIALFVFASRGVLLSLFAFFIYNTIAGNISRIRKVLLFLLLIVGYWSISIYGDQLLKGSIDFLGKYSIESRTLNMMENNVMDSDSGRNRLFEISYRMIEERPVFGWGVGGECHRFARELNQQTPDLHCSSHNGVLQAIVQLGIVGGLILSILIVYPIFRINRVKDECQKAIIVVYYTAYVLPSITVASGFLIHPEFAIMLFLFYFRNYKLNVSQQ